MWIPTVAVQMKTNTLLMSCVYNPQNGTAFQAFDFNYQYLGELLASAELSKFPAVTLKLIYFKQKAKQKTDKFNERK